MQRLLKTWVRFAGERENSSQRTGAALANFDSAKVERILVSRGAETEPVELARENGVWKVKSLWNAPANSEKVDKLIGQLILARGELRGTGKELFKDFGIDDTDSFSIKCLGTGDVPLLDLRVGAKKDGAGGSFIRKSGSADVYRVEGDLPESLGIFMDLETAKPSGDFWVDLRLFNLDPEKVTKIQIYLAKGTEQNMVAGLVREVDPKDPAQSTWKFLRQEMRLPLDSDKVVKFIATMNSVRAEKVVAPDGTKYGLEKPVWQLIVTENNAKQILKSGTKSAEGDCYYVKSSADGSVFSLKSSFFDDLNVDDTHFVKEVALPGFAKVPPKESGTGLPDGPAQTS